MKQTKQTLKHSGALSLAALALAMACGSAAAATVNDQGTEFTANVKVSTNNVCGVNVATAPQNSFQRTLHIDLGDLVSQFDESTSTPNANMLTTVTPTGAECNLNGVVISFGPSGADWAGTAPDAVFRVSLPKGGALDSLGQVSSVHLYDEAGADISTNFVFKAASQAQPMYQTDTDWKKVDSYDGVGQLYAVGLPPSPTVAAMDGYTKSNIRYGDSYVGNKNATAYTSRTVKQDASVELQNPASTVKAMKMTIGVGFLTSAKPVNNAGKIDFTSVQNGDSLQLNYVLTVNPV